MARKLARQLMKRFAAVTHEGASAYDYSDAQPLIHLTFTMGSALLVDGFYESERDQVRALVDALLGAWTVEPKFAWQYGAWMRDPVDGKGNRVQGSVVPAVLDAFTDDSPFAEEYVAKSLSHRPDDVTAFLRHFERLGLGRPSPEARKGMAQALTTFDEYQLMKYAEQKADDVRLCDAIMFVRSELEGLGPDAQLALDVGRYLHAASRDRAERAEALPLTSARRALWRADRSVVTHPGFRDAVAEARVTWEQVLSAFGDANARAGYQSALWRAMLGVEGLLGDTAYLRNVRNMTQAGIGENELMNRARERSFRKVWPHQVYAGYRTYPEAAPVFDEIFRRTVDKLPSGRHLGIGDASGSMCVRLGGDKSTLTCMDVAFCFVALMSETSGLGASFSDDTMMRWASGSYLSVETRRSNESPLKFSQRNDLRRGMGGTQVFGAVMELIEWLEQRPNIAPPDCLWFFSDMQFHPAAGQVPKALRSRAERLGVGTNVPPLEVAIRLYRAMFGHVDVVLWNLSAYSPVPVPADIDGVLLVSGFDSNTFGQVSKWREQKPSTGAGRLVEDQNVVLDQIRSY